MEQMIFTFGPAAAVLTAFLIVQKLEEQRRTALNERPPIHQKTLRGPGHSTRLKAEALREKASERALGCFVAAVALGYFLSRGPLGGVQEIVTALVLCCFVVGGFALAFHPLRRARAFHLGMRGEQFMAEELAKLQGYRVFHDLAWENWNIDHVVVGPGGVFAIETKTQRRRKPKPGRKDNEVVFTGNELEFSWCEDRKSIPQARRSAQSLARLLATSTGEEVTITPVLALPGWWVTLRAKCDVAILSGRQVAGFIRGFRTVLTECQVQRIAHQIDQRCRDVEF